jgi:predicted metal-dependent hydrolase
MNNSENHIQYKLIRSKRKTLSMSINNTSEIIVKSPLKLCDKIIYEWVQSKKNWIEKHLNIIKNKEQHKNIYQQKCDYEIGKQIPYMGGLIYLKDNKEVNINHTFFD